MYVYYQLHCMTTDNTYCQICHLTFGWKDALEGTLYFGLRHQVLNVVEIAIL
jgi:hypothetical protein